MNDQAVQYDVSALVELDANNKVFISLPGFFDSMTQSCIDITKQISENGRDVKVGNYTASQSRLTDAWNSKPTGAKIWERDGRDTFAAGTSAEQIIEHLAKKTVFNEISNGTIALDERRLFDAMSDTALVHQHSQNSFEASPDQIKEAIGHHGCSARIQSFI